MREKLDLEIARSIVAREKIAIVETELEQLGEELSPALPIHVSSAFIKSMTYERYDLNGVEDVEESQKGKLQYL